MNVQKIQTPNINPPQSAETQHKGFLARVVSWFSTTFRDIDTTVARDFHGLISNAVFRDVESIGVDILEMLGQVYLNQIMMQGPVEADESEGRMKQFAGSAAGQAIIMGGLNVAGSIPSLGQMTNLGQAADGIIQNLGMGYMNYQMMKPISEQTVENAVGSKYRETAQSNTLDEGQVTEAYSKGLLSEGEMDQQLSELGYREEFHPAIKAISQTTPDINTIQQMYDNNAINEQELVQQLKSAGYSNSNITSLVTSIKNKTVNPEITTIETGVKDLLASEHINDSQFRDMMSTIGKTDEEINKSLDAIRASQSIKGLQTEIDTLTNLYRQGSISQHSLATQLKDLGLEEEHISSMIEAQTQAIIRSNPTQRIITLDEQLAKGLIDQQDYMQELLKLGLGEEQSIAKLIQGQDKIDKQLGTSLQKGTASQADANIAYAEGTIDANQFRQISISLGTPASEYEPLIETLKVHSNTSVKPMPLDIIEQGVFNKVITIDKAIALIQANGYSPTISSLIAEVYSKTASGSVATGPDTTGGGINYGAQTSGKDIESLNPNRYVAQMTTFALNHTTQMSLIAMFYNSLIQGGYINSEQGVQLLMTLGLTQNDAELILS